MEPASSAPLRQFTPTPEEISFARALYLKRIERAPWQPIAPDSDLGRSCRTICAVVADQSDELQRMLERQFIHAAKLGEPAASTQVRDEIRRHLLSASTTGSFEIWAKPLVFYPRRSLVEFRWLYPDGGLALRFVCVEPDAWETTPLLAMPMTGKSDVIHAINSFNSREARGDGFLNIDAKDGRIEDYIRFFSAHVAAGDGFFHIVEDHANFLVDSAPDPAEGHRICGDAGEAVVAWLPDRNRTGNEATQKGPVPSTLEQLLPAVMPITRIMRNGEPLFVASVIYADVLFHAVYRVVPSGMIEMVDDAAWFDKATLPVRSLRDTRRVQEALRSFTGRGH